MNHDFSSYHASFSRRKPRRFSVSVASRLYALLRRIMPRHALTRFLLTASWLIRRFAWEQVWYDLPHDKAFALSRPHTLDFVRRSIPSNATVIDVGGGFGETTHVAAEIASKVLYVDCGAHNFGEAKRACAQDNNVELLLGDGLKILEERGPFDVALLLHILEHLDNPKEALERIHMYCGRVIIEVPDFGSEPLNFMRLRENLPCYSDADHVTEFSVDYMVECLNDAGWKVCEITVRNGVILAVADSK